ncbi:MAG TPA: AI-2E family transporter, partial [Candidatus Nanopelagicales bacterium]|nr:AI-2E family transporter [Candidatus Nanopelagicales bacterium]
SNNPRALSSRALVVVAAVAVITLCLWALQPLVEVALLVFAGVLLAVFLRGVSDWICRKIGLPQPWSLAAVVVGIVGILVAGAWLLAPSLAAQIDELVRRVPEALGRLGDRLTQYEWGRRLVSTVSEWDAFAPRRALQGATSLLSTTAGAVTSFLVFVFLGLFLAAEPKVYRKGLLKLVPIPRRARADEILSDTGCVLRRWLLGRFFSMSVVGAMTWIGLAVIGIPIAATLALLAAILTFIPYIGPLLSLLPAALLALLEGPATVGYVVALYAGIQLVESYLLTPMVQRQAVSLPPALTLTGVLVMGALAGGIGLVLATPLTAALLVLVTRVYVQDVLHDPDPSAA